MKKQQRRKGITLIALVITIIILLILAGIGITVVINGGVIQQAQNASDKYKDAQEEEQKQLDELYAYLKGEGLPENSPTTNAGTNVKLPEKWAIITPNYVSDENGKVEIASKVTQSVYAVSDGKGNTIPVPIGFYYVGGDLDTGVIISDKQEDKYDGKVDKTTWEYTTKLKGNQFIWIPCKEEEYKKCNVWNGVTQTSTSLAKTNWDTTVDIAGKIQVRKYGGFYVGRYEAGLAETIEEYTTTQTDTGSNQVYNQPGVPQSRAGKIPWIFIDWNNIKVNAESMYNNNYVNSGLITGTQWDVMLNKMVQKNVLEANDLISSEKWGNYSNTSIEYKGRLANVYQLPGGYTWYASVFGEEEEGKTQNYNGERKGVLLSTGASKQTEAYHIFDVAGNLWEYTEEISFYGGNTTNECCVRRGGGFSESYSDYPACYRNGVDKINNTGSYVTYRVVLYIR